jgi:hypothetical protein
MNSFSFECANKKLIAGPLAGVKWPVQCTLDEVQTSNSMTLGLAL